MHWKIARDPYYRPLYERYGLALVQEAGFFEDTDPNDAPLDDVRWLCTPLTRIHDNLSAPPDRPAVLVCTGSFSPVHAGHLAVMEAARGAVQAAGYTVVGGYLSPGHDEYITLKLGEQGLPATRRLSLCAAAVADSSWLMIDPWEALHRRVAVNFTDVVARLEGYLAHHLSTPVTVFYVCGSDNARFALTFALRGQCVVVHRPGAAEKLHHYQQHPLLSDSDRVLWADAAHDGSSTRARQGDLSVLPLPVRDRLGCPRPTALRLRLEGPGVVWPGHGAAWAAFQAALCERLSRGLSIQTVPISTQQIPDTSVPVISLDPLLPGDYAFEISRRFDLGGYTPRGHCVRPGAPPLKEQRAAFPQGPAVLFDDDICSGSTMAAARQLLPARVSVVQEISLNGRDTAEIADSRDFLLGSRYGGLVVALPDGHNGRAPYLHPYVDPTARSSVPDADTLTFSIDLWELNATFFDHADLTVADLPDPARRLMGCVGFSNLEPLNAVCRWHAAQLQARLSPHTETP